MAHFEKYISSQKGQLLKHYNRNDGSERHYSNQEICPERTHLNYNLAPARDEKDIDYLNKRIEQSEHLTRSNIVQMVDCVITLPKDYDGDSKNFFSDTYQFLEKDFGKDNVISSYVHMDETNPHMHFSFVPITDDNRLCAKDIITRDYLRDFHNRLQEHLRDKQPEHTINILSKDKDKARNLTMEEYKLKQITISLNEKTKHLNERITDYNSKAEYINSHYNSIDDVYKYCHEVDKYCDRLGYTRTDYYSHEYYADRGNREHQLPEIYNPEKTKEEKEIIYQNLQDKDKEIEKDIERDR